MNTIKRKRRRPRVWSYNFRTFFWVLVREACHEVYGRCDARDPWRCGIRASLADTGTFEVQRRARVIADRLGRGWSRP